MLIAAAMLMFAALLLVVALRLPPTNRATVSHFDQFYSHSGPPPFIVMHLLTDGHVMISRFYSLSTATSFYTSATMLRGRALLRLYPKPNKVLLIDGEPFDIEHSLITHALEEAA